MRQLMLTCVLCLAMGCDTSGQKTNDPNDPACQIQSPAEKGPGYPYDLVQFRTTILPTLITSCGTAGCHAAPQPMGRYAIWLDAAPGNCSYAKSFNSFKDKTDVNNPANSAVYIQVSGGNPTHPFKDVGIAQTILAFVQNANRTLTSGGGGGSAPPPGASPFDYTVFQQTIQPILDTADGKGCTNANCHGGAMGIGGLKLNFNPTPNSPEMESNFTKITSLCDLNTPEQSLFLLQATNRHASGASATVDVTQSGAILNWIKAAKNNAPGGNGGNTCPSPDNFDLGVFNTEIMAILTGAIDLNNPGGQRTTTGCSRATCHGADRTGGALVIKETVDAATNLRNFACFVNLANPTGSEILLCPLNQPGCRRYPHPGQNVFSGPDDLNYQRILSYLYAAKTVSTPIDFAFYARQIDTIFNDVNAVQGGAQNRTCADVTACHGVTIAGQRAPNGSNFPIIANASSKARLAANFASALNFINFISPEGSSLFMYPTDEISNLAGNRFATGLHHPGGLDFAIDSVQARAILSWAAGLRPDGQGFQPNWLVAGDYSAAAITDPTALDESNVKPAIFDPDGASQFNNGQWDALFADVGRAVDLNLSFPRAQTAGRVAYAAAYVLNASPSDIQAQITIVSPNAVKLYVGNQPVLQADDARNGATGLALLPAYTTAKSTTRLLIKVFQRSGDRDFTFTLNFRDQFGNPLTNLTGELIMKLSPDGGI